MAGAAPPSSVYRVGVGRTVQLVRLHASEWTPDRQRIAVAGRSPANTPLSSVHERGTAPVRRAGKDNNPYPTTPDMGCCMIVLGALVGQLLQPASQSTRRGHFCFFASKLAAFPRPRRPGPIALDFLTELSYYRLSFGPAVGLTGNSPPSSATRGKRNGLRSQDHNARWWP
jgi:hypothetical protein